MFSTQEFIEASREYVCVRLESYESEEHQAMVRSFLNGRFENTAFCLLAPDGKTRLTGSSRSPSHVLGATGRGPRGEKGSNEEVVREMQRIASEFQPAGRKEERVLQDFHSFRQALNVASGDQRLLLYVVAKGENLDRVKTVLQPVFDSPDVIGRFHLDFQASGDDQKWVDVVTGSSGEPGFYLIQSDPFGQKGSVVATLPLSTEASAIQATLLQENRAFATREERKVYSEHVHEGRRSGVHFKNGMPYGEDRDGDGKIDHRGGKKGPRSKG